MDKSACNNPGCIHRGRPHEKCEPPAGATESIEWLHLLSLSVPTLAKMYLDERDLRIAAEGR